MKSVFPAFYLFLIHIAGPIVNDLYMHIKFE